MTAISHTVEVIAPLGQMNPSPVMSPRMHTALILPIWRTPRTLVWTPGTPDLMVSNRGTEGSQEPHHGGTEVFQEPLYGGSEVFKETLHGGTEVFQEPLLREGLRVVIGKDWHKGGIGEFPGSWPIRGYLKKNTKILSGLNKPCLS